MKKKIFGFVRYSVLTDNSVQKSWNISKYLTFEQLEKELFATERLKLRGFLFENFTLPSIKANLRDWCELKLFVFTSEKLPKWHLDFLEDLKDRFSFIEIHLVGTTVGEMSKAIDQIIAQSVEMDEVYGTFEIGDDDALANCYIDDLKPYLNNSFNGILISFPLGYSGYFDLKKQIVTIYGETYVPMTAIGLCLISTKKSRYKHYFELGGVSHLRKDKLVPVLLLSQKHSYLRILHSFGSMYFNKNSYQAIRRTMSKIQGKVSLSEIIKDVNISSELFQSVSDDISRKSASILIKLRHLSGCIYRFFKD